MYKTGRWKRRPVPDYPRIAKGIRRRKNEK